MPNVYLGNHAALEKGQAVPGEQVTFHHIPEGDTHSERMRTLTHDDGVWPRIAAAPPAWVASDDDYLAEVLGAHFRCPVIHHDEGRQRFVAADQATTSGGEDQL